MLESTTYKIPNISELPLPQAEGSVNDICNSQNHSSMNEPPLAQLWSSSSSLDHTAKKVSNIWVIYSNGSCNKVGSGLGCLIITLGKQCLEKHIQLKVKVFNNKVECESIIYALKLIKKIKATRYSYIQTQSSRTDTLEGFIKPRMIE